VGFVVDNVALGQVFSEYFGFPANYHSTDCSTLMMIYHPELAQTGQLVADVPRGLSLTAQQETKKKKKKRSLTLAGCGAVSLYGTYNRSDRHDNEVYTSETNPGRLHLSTVKHLFYSDVNEDTASSK
jgi:hypothetical protein